VTTRDEPDPRDAQITALRRQLAGLASAVETDPRDIEIACLQVQVKSLAQAITKSTEPPREPGWISLPSGQCIPAECLSGYPAAHAAGFRWEGNTPVFPDDWPTVGTS